MTPCIREIRLAKGFTLHQVAARCRPPTTPQTVGRLETGHRTVSVKWLRRLAEALSVAPSDLVSMSTTARAELLPVAAVLKKGRACAPGNVSAVLAARPEGTEVAIMVEDSAGEYRAGDQIWCEQIEADTFGTALNRDVLLPRGGGRLLFGKLLVHEHGKIHLLPLGYGQRQQIVNDPPWLAVASKLVRTL